MDPPEKPQSYRTLTIRKCSSPEAIVNIKNF